MQINISGKHLDVGAALQKHVEADLMSTVKKYFDHAIRADVVFTKVRHLFRVDIIVNEGTGNQVLIKGNAEDDDIYAAFDMASTKIEKQLRRYKEKIRDHHNKRLDQVMEVVPATKYVISGNSDDHTGEEAGGAPVIIAEKPAEIERLTVSDAVMRMDLGQLPALMFINKKNNAINVVYRREDGNISWIDSNGMKEIAA